MINPARISGIGKFKTGKRPQSGGKIFLTPSGKVFLVENPNTLEVRTDSELARVLIAQYESVMKSRYFGNGGIEIIPSGQLSEEEIADLIRLSYNLSTGQAE